VKSEAHNVDCLAFMRDLPDNAFELAIADPPYGGAGEEAVDGGGGASEGGSTDTSRPPAQFMPTK
jgi:DNA modification methylase